MIWFWAHYLESEADAANPYASPLRAPDLGGVAPALVITAEHDPLRDEGERYAGRLRAAGTATVLSRYPGMIHGFLQLLGLFDESRQAVDEATAWLKERMLASAG
jgi:acetyl esterase